MIPHDTAVIDSLDYHFPNTIRVSTATEIDFIVRDTRIFVADISSKHVW